MENRTLETLEQNAASAAIKWAKTGIGYLKMEDAVNKYLDEVGVNRAIGNNTEAIRLGRRSAALRIDINCIHALSHDQEHRLHEALMKIAEDGVPRLRRGFRR